MSEKKLTRQQYLQQKANDLRQIALQYSLNRINPKTPYIENPETEETFYQGLKRRIIDIQEMIDEHKDQVDSDVVEFWNNKLESVQNQKYQKCIPGANCIYTATDNYSQDGIDRRVASNKIFQANPQKYGFQQIEESQLRPGDLVQVLDIKGLFPEHAMIYNRTDEFGNRRYNYSQGHLENTPEQAHPIVKDGLYPTMNESFYTFVGTPDDQRRWSEEYINKFITPNLKVAGIEVKTSSDKLQDKINLKANGGNMKKQLIKKAQRGTVLMDNNDPTKGTWGNRGQGNELQSALENGLSGVWNGVKWVGDKVSNVGNYVDRGLSYTMGLLPRGLSAEEMLENKKRKQNPQQKTYTLLDGTTHDYLSWTDVNGKEHIVPQTGTPPVLPALPANAPGSLIAIHNQMKKLIQSWRVGERRYQALGMADAMANSKTAQRYNQFLREFEEGVSAMGKSAKNVDDVKLYGKAEASYRSARAIQAPTTTTTIKNGEVTTKTKSIGTRAFNGRPVRKKYMLEIEDMLYKDQSPAAKKMYEQLRLKRAKISDPNALKIAEEKIFRDYATRRNLTHHLSKLGWIE